MPDPKLTVWDRFNVAADFYGLDSPEAVALEAIRRNPNLTIRDIGRAYSIKDRTLSAEYSGENLTILLIRIAYLEARRAARADKP